MADARPFDLGIAGLTEATRIGEGGNAVVYRARQPALDREVAVKILKDASDQDIRRRFDRERMAMGRLSQHDGIVTVYDAGFTDRDEPYIVMPLLTSSLEDDLASGGPMAWPLAATTMAEVCRTVGYAHRQGIVHRDIKPANIMQARSGRPLVADFGISRIMDSKASHKSTALTLTPAFSPPESLEAALAAPLADIYSLGATLYALVAGHPPFLEPDRHVPLLALMRRIMEEPVPPIDGVPDELQAVLATAMAKVASQRFGSAEEMASSLEAVVANANRPPAPSGEHAEGAASRNDADATLIVAGIPAEGGDAMRASTPRAPERGETGEIVDAEAPPSGRSRSGLLVAVAVSIVAIAVLAGFALSRSGGESVVSGPVDETTRPTATLAPAVAAPNVQPTSTASPSDEAAPSEPEPTAPTALPKFQAAGPQLTAAAGELIGPVDLEPYVSTLATSATSLWAAVRRGADAVSRIDAAAVAEAERYDLGFLPIQLVVNDAAIYGSDITGMIARLDRSTGELMTVQMDQRVGYLDLDESWLWVTTSTDGRDGKLLRLDPATLEETASADVGDFVFNLTSAGTHIWVSESSVLIGRDADSLEPLPTARPPLSSIDDLEAAGGVVWATGGQFDSELVDDELSVATVVAYDAGTGAALFETAVGRDLSIFGQLDIAATDDGAWVTNESASRGTFLDLTGAPIRTVELPGDTVSAVMFGDDLWIVVGSSSNGKLYRVTP